MLPLGGSHFHPRKHDKCPRRSQLWSLCNVVMLWYMMHWICVWLYMHGEHVCVYIYTHTYVNMIFCIHTPFLICIFSDHSLYTVGVPLMTQHHLSREMLLGQCIKEGEGESNSHCAASERSFPTSKTSTGGDGSSVCALTLFRRSDGKRK